MLCLELGRSRLSAGPLFLATCALAAAAGMARELVAMFSALIPHEAAHFIAARGYGLDVEEVELTPFGGALRIPEGAIDPRVEVPVALAGPLVNLALVSASLALGRVFPAVFARAGAFETANLALGLFNLLPVLPLDGGRVARPLLSRVVGLRRATRGLAAAGRFLGLTLCGGAVLAAVSAGISGGFAAVPAGAFNPTLLAVGVFLAVASGHEMRRAPDALLRELGTRGFRLLRRGVAAALLVVADGSLPMVRLISSLPPGRYVVVAVVRGGRLLGFLSEAELVGAAADLGPSAPLASAIDSNHGQNPSGRI